MKRFVIIFSSVLIWLYFFYETYRNTNYLEPQFTKCGCKLFVEDYSTGIFSALKSEYLTDSLNFRIHAGVFDDEREYYHYHCKGDSLSVEKVEELHPTVKIDSVLVHGKHVAAAYTYEDKKRTTTKYSLKSLRLDKWRWLLYKL